MPVRAYVGMDVFVRRLSVSTCICELYNLCRVVCAHVKTCVCVWCARVCLCALGLPVSARVCVSMSCELCVPFAHVCIVYGTCLEPLEL